MDMYLPSTPTIAANLHASQSIVQLTLSGCLAGLAVGQLVAGRSATALRTQAAAARRARRVRRAVVACAAAPDIGALIAFRFLQGMAAPAAWCCRSPSSATCTRGPSWPECSAR